MLLQWPLFLLTLSIHILPRTALFIEKCRNILKRLSAINFVSYHRFDYPCVSLIHAHTTMDCSNLGKTSNHHNRRKSFLEIRAFFYLKMRVVGYIRKCL